MLTWVNLRVNLGGLTSLTKHDILVRLVLFYPRKGVVVLREVVFCLSCLLVLVVVLPIGAMWLEWSLAQQKNEYIDKSKDWRKENNR